MLGLKSGAAKANIDIDSPGTRVKARVAPVWGVGAIFVAPGLCLIVAFYLFPALYNIFLSFRNVSLFSLTAGGASWAGFANFLNIWNTSNLAGVLLNTTLWLTVVTVSLRILFGLLIALILNGQLMQRRGVRGLARTLVLLPWTVPPVAAVLTWRLLFQANYGSVNQVLAAMHVLHTGGIAWLSRAHTAWVVIDTIIVWRELPLVVLMLFASLQTIPRVLYEAARVDGASWFRITWSVTLPQMRPVLGVVTLLTVITTFNNFVYVWLSTGGGPGAATDVLGTTIYKLAFVNYDIGASSAAAVVGTAIMAVFAVLYVFRGMSQDG